MFTGSSVQFDGFAGVAAGPEGTCVLHSLHECDTQEQAAAGWDLYRQLSPEESRAQIEDVETEYISARLVPKRCLGRLKYLVARLVVQICPGRLLTSEGRLRPHESGLPG